MSAAAHDEHDDGHGHGHSPWIQHHYDDAQHQFDSGKLGIWLFLAQEVLFFSALFVAYILYRHHHPEIYGYAHKYLDVKFGAINTGVLIFSSLTAAWAVRAAQLRQTKLLIGCLATTILCAMAFLGIKYIEYTHKVHEHLLFGQYFDPCIAANESPLLTKNNQCPGSKGSVLWDYDTSKPLFGCTPTFAIDSEPAKEGVQAECSVREITIPQTNESSEKSAAIDLSKFDPKSLNATEEFKKCEPAHGEEHEAHGGEACWKTSYQPAVCRPGWFWAQRCTAGPGVKKAILDIEAATKGKDEAAAKKALDEMRVLLTCIKDNTQKKLSPGDEVYFASQRYEDKSDCNGALGKQQKALNKIREAEMKEKCPDGPDADACRKQHQADPDLTAMTYNECVRSDQVGFVVEHHDHEVRPRNMVVIGTCKPPAKPAAEGDIFADRPQQLGLGVKAAAGEHVKTTHEEHEELYGGPPPEHTNMFFTIYFAMTGLHGIHVLVGIFIFIWLLIRAMKGHFTPEYFGPVDWAALYWHIVDLIWIFLFPLMYLIH